MFTLALKHSKEKNPVSQGGLAQGQVMAETGKYHWDEPPHLRQIHVCVLCPLVHFITLHLIHSDSSDRVDVSLELVLNGRKWRYILSPIKCEEADKSAVKVSPSELIIKLLSSGM